MSEFENTINDFHQDKPKRDAKEWFSKLIQEEQYVGDLYSTNYEQAKVLVHDTYREKVGGIPSLCFLIASRVNTKEDIDFKREDSSIILLRVMDSTAIPQDREVEKVRVQTAQRVTGITEKNWDDKDFMDEKTRSVFGYAGISCRIVGTFFLEENEKKKLGLKFGTDLSNFYSNMALKVYKPKGDSLRTLVNYIDPKNLEDHKAEFGNAEAVKLGKVRYASTNRLHQGIDDVPTYIYPADLLSQKSALFGMTRTGKSNTTKIIAKSVYELRHPKNLPENKPLPIGQIIFDPNGEYANENTQDASSGEENPTALKNIWELHCKEPDAVKRLIERSKNVVIYGLHPHSSDILGQERMIMKLNFYDYNMLENGKSIVNIALDGQEAQYFRNFKQVELHKPIKENFDLEEEFFEELKRFYRRTLAYFALLKKAGLEPPKAFKPKMKFDATKFLFSTDLRTAMSKVEIKDKRKEGLIKAAAESLGKENANWDSLPAAFEGLFYFLETDAGTAYNINYIKKSKTGQSFADSDFERILEMFKYSKGSNLIGKINEQHDPNSKADYADEIYQHLLEGKLVIVDQSSGNEMLNKASAERIMNKIFKGNQEVFRKGNRPKDILVYIEEAHNLLPSGKDLDTSDIWVRTAKEGAKYKIGLVYATQEVSSIQKNILRNTANWFISHLNNTDETKELTKYYDFIDFEPSIRRAQDKGFLRVKTLSSPFIVPMQIDKFEINTL
ncbi:MAG: hypothetical protein COA32_05780 [Fluviicola sp.]|nr:MAG: hypothetical protein COA32_05780 [Fluviicola sp.]